jgi:hypothetical protein
VAYIFVTKDGRIVRSAFGVTPEVIKDIERDGKSEIWFESFHVFIGHPERAGQWRSAKYDIESGFPDFGSTAHDCRAAGATYTITLVEHEGAIIAAPPGTTWSHRGWNA